jgi:hypothetical protein
MHGSEKYYNVAYSREEVGNKFTGDVTITKLRNNRFSSDKAFFNLEDVMGADSGVVNIKLDASNNQAFDTDNHMAYNYKDKAKTLVESAILNEDYARY